MVLKPITCKICELPIWGVKTKFKTFLAKYVTSSNDAMKKFNRIYNLPSDIFHNGNKGILTIRHWNGNSILLTGK